MIGAFLIAIVSAIAAAIIGAIIGARLQRRWTPDPSGEVKSLRGQVAALSEQVAAFQKQAEAMEKERAEFEHFPFIFSLRQGNFREYAGVAQNESNCRVSTETMQILRGDTNHESPLTEPVKPTPKHDWTLEPGTGKTVCWS